VGSNVGSTEGLGSSRNKQFDRSQQLVQTPEFAHSVSDDEQPPIAEPAVHTFAVDPQLDQTHSLSSQARMSSPLLQFL
jgi:hypothetical protein